MLERVMNVSQFIAALGGPSAAGRLFGVSPQAVCNWTARGILPERVHYRAARLASEHGLEFDPELGVAAAS